jgi:hypothetical protein
LELKNRIFGRKTKDEKRGSQKKKCTSENGATPFSLLRFTGAVGLFLGWCFGGFWSWFCWVFEVVFLSFFAVGVVWVWESIFCCFWVGFSRVPCACPLV